MVICYCEECGKEREIYYYAYHDMCHKCMATDPIRCEKQSRRSKDYWSNQENRDVQADKMIEYWSHQENRDDQSERKTEFYSHQENRDILSVKSIEFYSHQENRDILSDISREYWSHQDNRDAQSERLLNSDSRKSLAVRQSRDPKFGERVSAGKQHISYDEWEVFAAKKLYCPDFNEECKESNRNKYNRLCFITGLPEEENIGKNGKQRNLSVHHVDMDKGQGCNGIKWKLVPLCMEWHSKVHNKLWEARIIWLLNNVWNNQKVYIG